jgi:FKBP-type peptidyl-prolyl cis-trans isomerase
MLLQGTPAAAQATDTTAKPAATQGTSTRTTAKPGAAKPQGAATASHSVRTLKDQKDKISYALGVNVGVTLKGQSIDVDPNVLLQGVKDVLAGGKLLMTDEEVKTTLTQMQADLTARRAEKAKVEGAANKKTGDAFLAANKSKPGIVTLPSGLQYKILTQGKGPKPTANDTVVCNYRGTLIDGKEFDSSYKRGQPTTFPVIKVIPGWREALQLMPVGSKWQLVVPPGLAYGDKAAGPDIGPNSTLIFEVDLISIQNK